MMRLMVITVVAIGLLGGCAPRSLERSSVDKLDHNPATCDWAMDASENVHYDCTGRAFAQVMQVFYEETPSITMTIIPDNDSGKRLRPNKTTGYVIVKSEMLSPIIVTP